MDQNTTNYYERIAQQLRAEKCLGPNGFLGIWPAWLSWKDVDAMVERGMMVRKHYPQLYSHTDYYLQG